MTIENKKQYIDSLKKYGALANQKTTSPCDRCRIRQLSIQIWVWENRSKNGK